MDLDMEGNVNESIKEKFILRFVKGSKVKEILIQNEKYKKKNYISKKLKMYIRIYLYLIIIILLDIIL